MEPPQDVVLSLQPLKLVRCLSLLQLELRDVLQHQLLLAVGDLVGILLTVRLLRVQHRVEEFLALSGRTQVMLSGDTGGLLCALEGLSQTERLVVACWLVSRDFGRRRRSLTREAGALRAAWTLALARSVVGRRERAVLRLVMVRSLCIVRRDTLTDARTQARHSAASDPVISVEGTRVMLGMLHGIVVVHSGREWFIR